MKNIFFSILAIALILFSACEKDGPSLPPDNDGPPIVDTTMVDTTTVEDTVILLPPRYVPGDTTLGAVYGIWQDSFRWIASPWALNQISHATHPDDYIVVQFYTYLPWYEYFLQRENLALSEIPKNTIGVYKISKAHWDFDDNMIGGTFYTSRDDGDVSEDSYIVHELADDNELTITEVDIENEIYRGCFTVTLEINTSGGKVNPDNPDIIKIKDAEFWFKVRQ